MWQLDWQCFSMCGRDLRITADIDIDFITGLPFRGEALVENLWLAVGVMVGGLVGRYYSGMEMLSGGSININSIESLEVQVLCAMVVQIYGSLWMHCISGVHMVFVK
jgi:hypothetical protein